MQWIDLDRLAVDSGKGLQKHQTLTGQLSYGKIHKIQKVSFQLHYMCTG